MYLRRPRGLRDPERVAERLAMLETEPRVQPLRAYVSDLVSRRSAAGDPNPVVPHFDPSEAGIEASVLFVLEAPGPMTNGDRADRRRPGSGFISIDNDDATAANFWRARDQVELPNGPGASRVLHWNVVPWYLGQASRKPTAGELRDGAAELVRLLDLLPELRAVVMVGRYAQRGWARHVAPVAPRDYEVIDTWHSSPLALTSEVRRGEFHEALRLARHAAGTGKHG